MSPDHPEDILPTIERPVRLRDQVYEILRQKILDGEFPPGYKLPEEQLADQMNVNETPINGHMPRNFVSTILFTNTAEIIIRIYSIFLFS